MKKYLNDLNTIKDEQGASLVFVLMVMLVVLIFSTSAMAIFSANLKQAKQQQDRLEAYYLSYSGIEMAFESLISDDMEKTKEILNAASADFALVTNDIAFGNGLIDIKAEKSKDPGVDGWIKITSTAELSKNHMVYIRSMYFNPDNPNETFWINE